MPASASESECFQEASEGGGGLLAQIEKSFKTGEGEFGEKESKPNLIISYNVNIL